MIGHELSHAVKHARFNFLILKSKRGPDVVNRGLPYETYRNRSPAVNDQLRPDQLIDAP